MVLLSTFAYADDNKHYELAKRFDELSGAQDKKKLVDSILPGIMMSMPNLEGKEDILREHLIEVLSSQEYQYGKIKVYMSIYDEDQLRLLIEMAQSPGYKLLQDHRYEMNQGFIYNMNELIQKSMPEFREKLANQVE